MNKREEIIIILSDLVELIEKKDKDRRQVEEHEIMLMLKEELIKLTNFEFDYSKEDMVEYDELLEGYKGLIIQLQEEDRKYQIWVDKKNKEFDAMVNQKDTGGWTTYITDKNGIKREATKEEEKKVAKGMATSLLSPKTEIEKWMSKWNMYEKDFRWAENRYPENTELTSKIKEILDSGILKKLKDELRILKMKKEKLKLTEIEKYKIYNQEFGGLYIKIGEYNSEVGR